jgi:hypothetical protein
MHSAIEMTHQKKIEWIEELLEQLVIDTIAVALSNIIDRNLQKGSTIGTCHNSNCPYSYDIKF